MPDDRIPPSPYARLTMFCALVDEYDEIAEAFPVHQDSFQIGGQPRQPSDRWHRLVRAMVLRKFVLQEGDQVHLKKIAEALRDCAADDGAVEAAATIPHRLQAIADSSWHMREGQSMDEMRQANDIVEDVIYGGFMHGDYGKWKRTENRSDLMVEHPLWIFTSKTEGLIRETRDAIRAFDREGRLRDR